MHHPVGLLLGTVASLTLLASASPGPDVPVRTETVALESGGICTGSFATHELEHVTAVPRGHEVRGFEANGAGVGIGDLDDDGDLDVVLANHAGPDTLLWNEGGLAFRREPLGPGDARAVAIVDVDADGRQDVVLGRRVGPPNWWRNRGGGFGLEPLPGVARPLYALDWADLDGDGDLDLAGGTYDAALLTEHGHEFLLSGHGGVYVYRNDAGRFRETRLADGAQALALLLVDVVGDARPDVLVGNDFAVPDGAWETTPDGWVAAAPFPATTHSTMSLAAADLDNDGALELFATDMKPYPGEPIGPWEALLAAMAEGPPPAPAPGATPQVMENVLLRGGPERAWTNEAGARGVAATGWSWSGVFGDLDRDGHQDLYVVNGMIEAELFAGLPGHELAEANQAFRNDGAGGFAAAPEWGLGVTTSGRGMAMADLDGDGDLDIVVNNLRGPAQLHENRLCGGDALLLDLRWPGGPNPRAVGAVAFLATDRGTYRRDVRVGSGYLSSGPARLHFGLPAGARILDLAIRWPDGRTSLVEGLEPGRRVTVTRSDGAGAGR